MIKDTTNDVNTFQFKFKYKLNLLNTNKKGSCLISRLRAGRTGRVGREAAEKMSSCPPRRRGAGAPGGTCML